MQMCVRICVLVYTINMICGKGIENMTRFVYA